MFAQSSPGPVAEQWIELALVGFDAEGEYTTKPENIKPAVENCKARLEYIEE